VHDVGKTRDIGIALLDDGESKNRQIHSDDAAADGFALALTSSAGSETGMAIRKEKSDSSGVHDALLHRETLLVVAASDLEDVALELITNAVARNLLTHPAAQSSEAVSHRSPSPKVQILPLVDENTQLSLIFNLNQLLAAIGRL
jgi:hypothetical protein